MVKEIPLQNGMVALVDDEDYERVSKHVWTANKSNTKLFVLTTLNQEVVLLRRFVLNAQIDTEITHKNGDGLDCRKENLLCGNRAMVSKTFKGHRNSSSKYKGVCWRKKINKWTAQIKIDGKSKYLGCFINEDDAALAYNKAAIKFFGEHAYQNKIGENNLATKVEKESNNKIRRTKTGKSGYKNVVLTKSNRFESSIVIGGKRVYIGTFDTPKQAAKAYDQKAYEIYGDKAILNFPELIDEYKQALQRGGTN